MFVRQGTDGWRIARLEMCDAPIPGGEGGAGGSDADGDQPVGPTVTRRPTARCG